MVFQGLAQVGALGKQVLVAAYYGTSTALDAYLVALVVAGLVRIWVSLPIRQTVVPLFRHDLAENDEAVAWAHVSVLLNNLVFVLAGIALAMIAVTPLIVRVAAPGFDADTRELTTVLARVMMLSVVFAGLQQVLAQILFSYERFFLPALAACAESVVAIVALVLLAPGWGIHAVAAAVVLGAAAGLIVVLPVLWQKRALYRATVDFRHPRTLEMARLSLPLCVSAGGGEIARVADRAFASMLGPGMVSALAFAQRLVNAANDLFIDTVQQALFPHLTKLAAQRRFAELSSHLFRYLRLSCYVAIPMAVGAVVLADLVVTVVFARGEFGATSVALTAGAFACYALGFPAVAAARMLTRTFFGLKNTTAPMKVSLGRLGLKLPLTGILIAPFGHLGIALADSLSQAARVALLLRLLPREIRRAEVRETVRSVLQSTACAIVMGIALVALRGAIDGAVPPPVALVTLIGAGALTYVIATFLVRAEELAVLRRTLALVGARLLAARS